MRLGQNPERRTSSGEAIGRTVASRGCPPDRPRKQVPPSAQSPPRPSGLSFHDLFPSRMEMATWRSQSTTSSIDHDAWREMRIPPWERRQSVTTVGSRESVNRRNGCTPNRIRTGVPSLKSSCPRPLDDGGRMMYSRQEVEDGRRTQPSED